MASLIDTNMLVAPIFTCDMRHHIAQKAVAEAQQQLIVAAPCLVELSILLTARLDYSRMVERLKVVRENFQIEPLSISDLIRIEMIMAQYHEAQFDYTDGAIMALSERLQITQVYTFDRRDFLIFRPVHCAFLELLPVSV